MRARSLVLVLVVVVSVVAWPVGGGTNAAVGAVAAASDDASPTVGITIGSTAMLDGDTYETGSDVEITIDASVGDGSDAGSVVDEIVVRLNDERYRTIPTNDSSVSESIEPDLDGGENEVRIIVTDDENNVDATQFEIVKDSEAPHLFLTSPYETAPWKDVRDGNASSTDVVLAGTLIEDSDVAKLQVRHVFGDHRDVYVRRDVGSNFSLPLRLGYGRYTSRTNEFRVSVTDEFDNTRFYEFEINASDAAGPTVDFEPVPNETTKNRVFVAGTVADDVWIDQANVTFRDPESNRTGYRSLKQPRTFDLDVDRRSVSFNRSLYMVYPGTYEATVAVTDIAGNTTTRTVTIERLPKDEGDATPEISLDRDRTVVLNEETLFLSGAVFEGVTERVVVETRDAESGGTVDYQVVYDGRTTERVDFDREVGIVDGRTEVIVRATDAADAEHTREFFVDGGEKSTFVGEPGDDDSEDSEDPRPAVTVEPLEDGRPGTASSIVTVRRADAGSSVSVPQPNADGAATDAVTGTANVTLERLDVSVATATNFTSNVEVRDRTAGALAGQHGSTAATVTIHHSLAAENVSGLVLDLAVDREYLDAHGIDPGNLSVYRQSGGNWTALSTELLERNETHVRYRADSPGLSVFSLATEPATAGESGDGTDGNETGENGSEERAWPPVNETDWTPDVELGDGSAGNESVGNDTGGNATGDGGAGDGTNSSTTDGSDDGTNADDESNGEGSNADDASGDDSGDESGAESRIVVTETTVNRTAVSVNESVGVDATLVNRGDTDGTFVAGLHARHGLNRSLVETRRVDVPAGENRSVAFVTAFDRTGNHTVSVNGTQAEQVVVEDGGGGGGLLSMLSFVPVGLIGMGLGGVVGLLLVLVLARFVLRRVGGSGESAGG